MFVLPNRSAAPVTPTSTAPKRTPTATSTQHQRAHRGGPQLSRRPEAVTPRQAAIRGTRVVRQGRPLRRAGPRRRTSAPRRPRARRRRPAPAAGRRPTPAPTPGLHGIGRLDRLPVREDGREECSCARAHRGRGETRDGASPTITAAGAPDGNSAAAQSAAAATAALAIRTPVCPRRSLSRPSTGPPASTDTGVDAGDHAPGRRTNRSDAGSAEQHDAERRQRQLAEDRKTQQTECGRCGCDGGHGYHQVVGDAAANVRPRRTTCKIRFHVDSVVRFGPATAGATRPQRGRDARRAAGTRATRGNQVTAAGSR